MADTRRICRALNTSHHSLTRQISPKLTPHVPRITAPKNSSPTPPHSRLVLKIGSPETAPSCFGQATAPQLIVANTKHGPRCTLYFGPAQHVPPVTRLTPSMGAEIEKIIDKPQHICFGGGPENNLRYLINKPAFWKLIIRAACHLAKGNTVSVEPAAKIAQRALMRPIAGEPAAVLQVQTPSPNRNSARPLIRPPVCQAVTAVGWARKAPFARQHPDGTVSVEVTDALRFPVWQSLIAKRSVPLHAGHIILAPLDIVTILSSQDTYITVATQLRTLFTDRITAGTLRMLSTEREIIDEFTAEVRRSANNSVNVLAVRRYYRPFVPEPGGHITSSPHNLVTT